ncbi:MAG: DUF1802 family protein [Verrucomicrobiales bacterium]|nr:DUF1802 family protein [Verrucomicrobiales bacterium]
MSSPSLPPAAIGFKEWAFVCDALAQGKQTLILRKGGIHEGMRGFQFQHAAFFLFPTWFHTQGEALTWVPSAASAQDYSSDPGYDATTLSFPPEETRQRVDIDAFCTLEGHWRVTDWDRVAALAPLHIWKESVVRERFAYDEESCLHIALVRTWRLPQRWTFDYEKKYGGCRSWVNVPDDGLSLLPGATPALTDAAWAETAEKIRGVLESGAA